MYNDVFIIVGYKQQHHYENLVITICNNVFIKNMHFTILLHLCQLPPFKVIEERPVYNNVVLAVSVPAQNEAPMRFSF